MKRFLFILLSVCVLLSGCGAAKEAESSEPDKDNEASRKIFAMDTIMTIQVYGEGAEEAAEEAVAEIHRLDKLLSTGDADSEVSRLNSLRSGILSDDSTVLMAAALDLFHQTGGAFDISIYPVMELWGFTDNNFHVPEEDALDAALALVDASKIEYDESSGKVKLAEPGMKIDFGGIAKGYTSSRLADMMKKRGIESALINLGGNVQAVGAKTDGSKWKIGIQDPEDTSAMLGVISIEDRCVITSGGYERYFEQNGQRYHHIIDPETGYPAQNGLISASVIGTNGMYADGLSTSLYIMGEDRAIGFWRESSLDFDMILETADHRILVTEGIAGDFSCDREFDIIKK